MGSISYLVGATVGGFLLASIIGWIVEKFAFRNLPPTARASWTMGVAWVVICGISGFGAADGGPFVWTAGLAYIPGTFIAWFLYRRRLVRAWNEEQAAEVFQ